MIFDGHWKWELQKLSWEIFVWSKMSVFGELAEHRLNRAILYSATILRKLIEDETEAEEIVRAVGGTLPGYKTTHAILTASKFPYTAEEGWTVRGKVCIPAYGTGQTVAIKAKNICNWLIHSYVWSLVYYSKRSGAKGFLVASDFDREK